MSPDSLICYTGAELEALRGKPLVWRVIYTEALRPYMDRSTRTVGQRRRVSYQGIRETVEVEPVAGVPTPPRLSDDQIYRALQGLQRAGLLELADQSHLPPRDRRLVAVLPLAVDSLAQNQAAIRPRQQAENRPRIVKTDKSEAYADVGVQAATMDDPQAAIPPESRNTAAAAADARARTGVTLDETPPDEQFRIPEQLPDDHTPEKPMGWVAWFTRQGWRPDQVQTARTIPLFRSWCEQGITVGEVRDAVLAGETRNGGRPRSVAYFASFVQETRRARRELAESANETTPTGQGGDHDRRGRDSNFGATIREKHSRPEPDLRSKVERQSEAAMEEYRRRKRERAERLAKFTAVGTADTG